MHEQAWRPAIRHSSRGESQIDRSFLEVSQIAWQGIYPSPWKSHVVLTPVPQVGCLTEPTPEPQEECSTELTPAPEVECLSAGNHGVCSALILVLVPL